MNGTQAEILRQIWYLLQNSSGGSSANVDITGNSAGLATEVNIIDLENTLSNLLSTIRNQQTDNNQRTRITDGTDTLAINADGSINTSVPANLVRESFPNSIEQKTSNIVSNTQLIIDNFNTNGFYTNEREKSTLCIGVKVINSPNIGDTTYYLGYENNDYPLGSHQLQTATFAIKKVILFADGGFEYFWSNGLRNNYNLIFDDGSQNYLTYTYL